MNTRRLQIIAWSLSAAVSVAAFVAWGQSHHWDLAGLSTYQLFPLFGLLAFSLMWSHYVVSALRLHADIDRENLNAYFTTTRWLVLVALLLHPGLLSWQLWRDGFGLPPESYLEHYVAPSLKWVALLGTVSLGIFLFYELERFWKEKGWWKYAVYASDLAMIAIWYHAITLGDQLQDGSFRWLWLFYGVVYVVALIYSRTSTFRRASHSGSGSIDEPNA